MRKNTKKRTGRNSRKTVKKIYGGDIDEDNAQTINTIIFNGLDRMAKTNKDCMEGINEIINGTILNAMRIPIDKFIGEKFDPLFRSIGDLLNKNEKKPDFNTAEWESIDEILRGIAGIQAGEIAPKFLFTEKKYLLNRNQPSFAPIYISIETKINDALAIMIVITDLIKPLLWVLGK
jgi:hypothetical protein